MELYTECQLPPLLMATDKSGGFIHVEMSAVTGVIGHVVSIMGVLTGHLSLVARLMISNDNGLNPQMTMTRLWGIYTRPCFNSKFTGIYIYIYIYCFLKYKTVVRPPPLYHTWVWNRGICMCVIVRPRSHMLIVLKKVIPDTTRYDFA